MKLLLFDIDGTLLHTHGVGRRAVQEALSEITGQAVTTGDVDFSGKTDPQILREVLVATSADEEWLNGRFPEAVNAYQATMKRLFEPERVTALPGAVDLVEHLAAEDRHHLGLLTGNLRPLAYLKIGAIGLDRHFPFGAFGCDDEDRNNLPVVATSRAEEHTGWAFAPDEVVVIGDTPRDVACGRAFGARVVAVATGRFDREALAAHDPDVLLDDLSDLDTCVDAVTRV
jgi:phosphoglycolate phosphatase